MASEETNLMICDYKGDEYNFFVRKLEKHPFFKNFSGHPHAISLIAPMVRDYRLVDLYKLVISKTFVEGALNESHPINSLKNSLLTSIQHMLQRNPKAITLFALIGLMPGGVTEIILSAIWGPDWYSYIADLMEA